MTFVHNGSRNFIVRAIQGGQNSLLVNVIGAYQGTRPLTGTEPVTFDIQADGAWTAVIEAIPSGGAPPFSGRSDGVSDLFNPPPSGPWEFRHDGQRNFIVKLQCAGGMDLVQNQIGPVSGSRVVQFRRGPCYWDVQADGNWSLSPRQ